MGSSDRKERAIDPDRKERAIARRKKRETTASSSPQPFNKYLLIPLGFLAIWGGALYFAHSTLGALKEKSDGVLPFVDHNTPHKQSLPQQQQIQQKDVLSHIDGNDNTYYGWQPKIAPTMECSWRACLQTVNKCQTCRDSQQDLQPVPPPPSEDWIPDVTMLRRMLLEGHDSNGNPWPPALDQELCEPIGTFGGKLDQNLQALNVSHIIAKPFLAEKDVIPPDASPKLLCLVYTMKENHATNIRAIRETWGSYCDGFLAFSTASDPRIPAISIPHDGPEEYNNMWQKVRHVLHHYTTQVVYCRSNTTISRPSTVFARQNNAHGLDISSL
jgi:hypothetical protein